MDGERFPICFNLLGALILALAHEYGEANVRRAMIGWSECASDETRWEIFKSLVRGETDLKRTV